jgi:hypothetical protein
MNNNKTQKSCFGWVNSFPLLIAICFLFFASANAQTALYDYRPGVTAEGAVYFLPKTGVRLRVLVEKTSYKPGDFSAYAQRYLRLYDVVQKPTVSYRVVGITQQAFGVPDSTKAYAVKFNAKSVAANISLTSDGRLLAINATPQEENEPKAFKSAPKPAQVNPRQLMGEEILSAGSTAKMAELTAREIYDLRENRNLLIKGQADFMPNDGNQMQLMLNQLESQEKSLLTLFQGTTVRDTTENVITICPDGTIDRQVAFRLSQKLGVVDDDDLSGTPYYVRVENLTAMPSVDEEEVEQAKKKQPESGIYVNVPGKMRVSVFNGIEPISVVEHPAGQLGNVELLSGDLFNKHYTTHLWLNPVTGAVERLEAEQPK